MPIFKDVDPNRIVKIGGIEPLFTFIDFTEFREASLIYLKYYITPCEDEYSKNGYQLLYLPARIIISSNDGGYKNEKSNAMYSKSLGEASSQIAFATLGKLDLKQVCKDEKSKV